MNVIETDWLVLRHLTTDDAAFILALTNDPSWVQSIGDIGVRTLEEASAYIVRGPTAMYAREGFGLYLTALKDAGIPIGICGLIKRASLDDVDIGFAFLPPFWFQDYVYEAASATLVHGRQVLGLQRIVAITTSENQRSVHLLEKLDHRGPTTMLDCVRVPTLVSHHSHLATHMLGAIAPIPPLPTAQNDPQIIRFHAVMVQDF